MLSTAAAISRLRRDLALGSALKGLLLAAGLSAGLVLPFVAPSVHSGAVLMGVAAVWLVLSYNSAKGARASADVPGLIAAGRYEEAERQLDAALRRFTLIRAVKFQTLHQLALLRHAQRRYREAGELCRALLGQRLGNAAPMAKSVRLLLADAMLELDDLPGAHAALSGLYGQPLALPEMLQLLAAQLDYESRIGAWDRMMNAAMAKVQLAELMPASSAAAAQALLAVAARETGRDDFCDWLRSRAGLLADPADLVAGRPVLADLWPGTKAER